MPVQFDSCFHYESCQSSFRWEAVCCEQISVSESCKPAQDIVRLRREESKNPSLIKFWVSWLLPMEETLLLRIAVAQSSE